MLWLFMWLRRTRVQHIIRDVFGSALATPAHARDGLKELAKKWHEVMHASDGDSV